MKKGFLMLLTVILTILMFAACSSNGTDTKPAASDNPAAKPIELRYQIWDQNQAPAYQKIIDNFMKENPNIRVTMQVVPFANYFDKMLAEISGGSAPDVFWSFIPRVKYFANKGVLLDISKYVKQDNFDLSKFNPALVKAFEDGDKRYAIPKDWDSTGLFYNKDLLEKAGFKEFPKDLKWNPEDGGTFVEFLQKLTLDKNGKHPNEPGFDAKNTQQYGFMFIDRGEIHQDRLINFTASNGGAILKDDKLALDDKLVGSLQFLYDNIYKYKVHPGYVDIHTTGSEAKFFSQQVAVWMQGSWMMKPIKEKASFKWDVAPMVAGPVGTAVKMNGLGDSIFAKTKYPDEAWKFVSYILSKKGQDILAETGTVFPGNEDSISKFVDFYKGLGIDPKVFIEQRKNSVTPSVANNITEWEKIFVKYASLSLAGETEPRAALEKIKAEGDAVAGKK